MDMDWFLYEKEAAQKGYSAVCGIDEAGRGPLAGPVFAAAVILPAEVEIPGLNDAKKLTAKKTGSTFPVDSGKGSFLVCGFCHRK